MFLKQFSRKRYNFTFDFFQENKINPFFESLINNTNKSKVVNENFITEKTIENVLHEINFIPAYFDISLPDLPSGYKLIKFHRLDDFLANLKGQKDAEDYMKSVMSPKRRWQLRTKKRRLESCFHITYNLYHGNISKEEYKFLFNELKTLIKRRFVQRGDLFFLDNQWAFLNEHTYKLILEKKASFFVIYDGEKPISICLNYHFENIMQSFISSYDIDYSKFGIGQIATIKKIDWCFKNNIKIFDLMWGEVPHKILWCNDIRSYEHHIIYKNNHILKTPYVRILIIVYHAKDYLKQRKITKSLLKLRKSFKNNIQSKPKKKESDFKFEAIENMPLGETITKISINREPYAFLRKTVYDFQYLNFDITDNVRVYKINNLVNSYIIKGAKSQIKILAHDN